MLYSDHIWEVLWRPHKAFSHILDYPVFEHAIHVPLILGILGLLSGLFTFSGISVFFDTRPTAATQLAVLLGRYKLVLLPALFPLILCFLVAMVIHLIAELPCRAESTYEETVTMTGFAMVPFLFSRLVMPLLAYSQPHVYITASSTSAIIASRQLSGGVARFFSAQQFTALGQFELLLTLWTFCLFYIGIKEQYKLKWIPAIITLSAAILCWITLNGVYSVWLLA